jgi:hypothetical protein
MVRQASYPIAAKEQSTPPATCLREAFAGLD